MKTPVGIVWVLSFVFTAGGANAAELELEGSRLVVSGMLDGSAIRAFEDHLASGKIRTVVFENSLGGSPEVARDFAQAIRATNVNTEAKGQCHAACAYAFLAGKEHRFGRGFQVNGLLIPVSQRPRPADLVSRWSGEDGLRTLADFTAPAGASAVSAESPASGAADATPAAMPASAPKERWQPNQGVLFTSTPTLFGRVYNSFYCDGTQGRDMSRCELLSDADPYKLGVLTP
ncbi:hypothetical protein QTI24_29115 [Variovorax sp. J22P240]|uniref:hypothetical protein n=1 Tax=Variovorax sp. J22P240 TaxID=3053514 RepID=UPI002574A810|nr:hypothetical protein [Variovorax sp. J22P240]MDM0002693.1 hypothetical protein [Variovorax sp. J22P240]